MHLYTLSSSFTFIVYLNVLHPIPLLWIFIFDLHPLLLSYIYTFFILCFYPVALNSRPIFILHFYRKPSHSSSSTLILYFCRISSYSSSSTSSCIFIFTQYLQSLYRHHVSSASVSRPTIRIPPHILDPYKKLSTPDIVYDIVIVWRYYKRDVIIDVCRLSLTENRWPHVALDWHLTTTLMCRTHWEVLLVNALCVSLRAQEK